MMHIDFSTVPGTVRVNLCALAIMRTAEAMKTPEGRSAIEKGRAAYLLHLAEKEGKLREST